MKGLRVLVVLVVALAAAGAVASAATPSSGSKLRVTPASGKPSTTFTVHFTAPGPSGTSGGTTRSYSLTASPAHAGHGCIDSVGVAPQPTRSDQAVAVKLNPRGLGGRWCASTYSGRITETIRPSCGPPVNTSDGVACPEYIAIAPIGTLKFRVTG